MSKRKNHESSGDSLKASKSEKTAKLKQVSYEKKLAKPTDREHTEWYFQRYIQHLPCAGEMVLFDRSWYNRTGVERVMGFCTEAEVEEFFRSCPEFERMIVRSGIILVKYWFSVSDDEQERRFQQRIDDPTRRWKLSDMDLAGRTHWVEYSRAKDDMFAHTDIKQAPWVRRRRRRQTARPPELHLPSPVDGCVRRSDPGAHRAASASGRRGICASPGGRPDFRAAGVLTASRNWGQLAW